MLSPCIQGREWTQEEKEYLKANYKAGNIKAIAEHLNRSEHSVVVKACRMHLKSGYFLSEEQIEYMEKYSHKSNVHFAEKFGKHASSISECRARNGIGMASDSGLLSLMDISRITGTAYQTVKMIWRKRGLKAQRSGLYVLTSEKHLIEFLKAHPDLWDATKCDKSYFQRFDWFEEKHKKDFDRMVEKRWSK